MTDSLMSQSRQLPMHSRKMCVIARKEMAARKTLMMQHLQRVREIQACWFNYNSKDMRRTASLRKNIQREMEEKDCTMFVGGLSMNENADEQKQMLKLKFPQAIEIKVAQRGSGNSKGYAFVKFQNRANLKRYLGKQIEFGGGTIQTSSNWRAAMPEEFNEEDESVNMVYLLGYVALKPSKRINLGNVKYVEMLIVTSRHVWDREAGDFDEKKSFHNVLMFDENLMQYALQNLHLGDSIYVCGPLTYSYREFVFPNGRRQVKRPGIRAEEVALVKKRTHSFHVKV